MLITSPTGRPERLHPVFRSLIAPELGPHLHVLLRLVHGRLLPLLEVDRASNAPGIVGG